MRLKRQINLIKFGLNDLELDKDRKQNLSKILEKD